MKATYINHYLTDNDVANFARQSFAKLADSFTPEKNHSLIKFLARGMATDKWEELLFKLLDQTSANEARDLAVYLRKIPEHWVPFGHPHISIRMQAPVPIARQLFKHKIGFVESEESRRYISSRPEVFIPEYFRPAAASVKQGSSDIPHEDNGWMTEQYIHLTAQAIGFYELMIERGICPEQARFALPQGVEVNWVWTGSLYAFANMYNQRSDSHAQKESQILASEINEIISPLYPVSWSALTQGNY